MSERKVLNKYYPPDFDPSKVPRAKKKDKKHDVRIMAPFNMKCNTCGEYIAQARKFNAKKETIEDQTYKGLSIFRFYIKCPRCMSQIIFRTNLKDKDYEVEAGATENFMALKLAEKRCREEREAEEVEEKINPMKHLESRTKESKKQVEAGEQIQNMRSISCQRLCVDIDKLIESRKKTADEDGVEAELRELMKRKSIKESSSQPGPSKKKNKVLGSGW